jgi:hypothetical protein
MGCAGNVCSIFLYSDVPSVFEGCQTEIQLSLEVHMLGIIKKDLIIYLIYFFMIALFPVLNIGMDGMERGVVTGLGNMMMFSVIYAAAANELLEDKHNGYTIMKNMPVTPFQIVSGKYFLVLVFTLLNVGYGTVLLAFFSETKEFMVLGTAYLIIMGNLSMVFAALNFYLVYTFGFTKVTRPALFLMPLLFMMSPLVILLKYGRQLRQMDLAGVVALASPVNLCLLCCAGLVCFYLLMRVSESSLKSMEV